MVVRNVHTGNTIQYTQYKSSLATAQTYPLPTAPDVMHHRHVHAGDALHPVLREEGNSETIQRGAHTHVADA